MDAQRGTMAPQHCEDVVVEPLGHGLADVGQPFHRKVKRPGDLSSKGRADRGRVVFQLGRGDGDGGRGDSGSLHDGA